MSSKVQYRKVVSWEDLPKAYERPGVTRSEHVADEVMLAMNYVDIEMGLNPHVHHELDLLAYIVTEQANCYIDEGATT